MTRLPSRACLFTCVPVCVCVLACVRVRSSIRENKVLPVYLCRNVSLCACQSVCVCHVWYCKSQHIYIFAHHIIDEKILQRFSAAFFLVLCLLTEDLYGDSIWACVCVRVCAHLYSLSKWSVVSELYLMLCVI